MKGPAEMAAMRPEPGTDVGDRIMLAHGGGGQLTDDLVGRLVLPRLGNAVLSDLADAAVFDENAARLAFTIDSYVVQPLFFPGGDIGRLAVSGTVNDLAVSGARPLGLALSLILEEGLERRVLESVLDSVAATAKEAGVRVLTGDTKVVGRGQADGMYITTAGIGAVRTGRALGMAQVRPGDVVLLSGPVGDHGLTVMLARQMPQMQLAMKSDAAPLNGMIGRLLADVPDVVFMRDATRGGLAGVMADVAHRCGRQVVLEEDSIPVRPQTRHAAEMLGLDVLEVANEGSVVVVVRPGSEQAALAALRQDPCGKEAAIIGKVTDRPDGVCELQTPIGGRRIVQKPYGEQLPRIC